MTVKSKMDYLDPLIQNLNWCCLKIHSNLSLYVSQVAKSATGKMYKRGTFGHLALHSGVVSGWENKGN